MFEEKSQALPFKSRSRSISISVDAKQNYIIIKNAYANEGAK